MTSKKCLIPELLIVILKKRQNSIGFALAEMRSLSNSDIEQYYKIMQEIEQIKTVELNRIKSLLQEKLRAFIHS